jgi:hypothetical protein
MKGLTCWNIERLILAVSASIHRVPSVEDVDAFPLAARTYGANTLMPECFVLECMYTIEPLMVLMRYWSSTNVMSIDNKYVVLLLVVGEEVHTLLPYPHVYLPLCYYIYRHIFFFLCAIISQQQSIIL